MTPPAIGQTFLKKKNENWAQECCIFLCSHLDKRNFGLKYRALSNYADSSVASWITIWTWHLMANRPAFVSVGTWGNNLTWDTGLWSSLSLPTKIGLRLCKLCLLNHLCLFAWQSSNDLEMLLPEASLANVISQLQLQTRKIISSPNRGARHFWEIRVNKKTKSFLQSRLQHWWLPHGNLAESQHQQPPSSRGMLVLLIGKAGPFQDGWSAASAGVWSALVQMSICLSFLLPLPWPCILLVVVNQ